MPGVVIVQLLTFARARRPGRPDGQTSNHKIWQKERGMGRERERERDGEEEEKDQANTLRFSSGSSFWPTCNPSLRT
jgi:hypothetical protein